MPFLFKNKQKKELLQASSIHDKIAVSIVQKCIAAQTRWANYMQQKTEKFSVSAKKYGLILFCLLSGACSIYLGMKSLYSNGKQDVVAVPISVPTHSTQAGDKRTRHYLILTKAEFGRIETFWHYMDSLGQSPQRLAIRDSILALRSGLMDSNRTIEKLYELQTLKK